MVSIFYKINKKSYIVLLLWISLWIIFYSGFIRFKSETSFIPNLAPCKDLNYEAKQRIYSRKSTESISFALFLLGTLSFDLMFVKKLKRQSFRRFLIICIRLYKFGVTGFPHWLEGNCKIATDLADETSNIGLSLNLNSV